MNTTINVRGLDESEYTAAQAHASAAGQSLEAWVRGLVRAAVAAPVVRSRYAYRAAEPGKALIKRHSDHPNGTVVTGAGWSQEQATALERVKLLVARNAPGDREQAVSLLQAHFEIVIEAAI